MPFKIETITAFISVDPKDGKEGIIGMRGPDGWVPFVCADEKRIESIRPIAQQIASEKGIKVVVARFGVRTNVEEINP